MKFEKNSEPKPKRLVLLLCAVVLLATAAYFLKAANIDPKQESDKKKWDKANKEVLTVLAVPAIVGDVPVYLNALGTVTGLRTVTVRSRVDGELMKVAFKEGALVKAGELLAEVDPRTIQIQIMQIEGQLLRDEALLKNAEVDLTRYQTLLAQDSIAGQQVVTQESLVKQSQGVVATDRALLANAKLQLSYAKITAPITGRLGLRLVDQGNIIHASDANGLVVITQIQPIAVLFTLPEDDLPRVMKELHAGTKLAIEAYDRSGKIKIAQGELLAVDNQIDTNTGTVKLKAQFANDDGSLFPNQFVNIKMLIDTLHSVIIIPSAAVQTSESGSFVHVVKEDATVTIRPIKLGAVVDENVAVLEGLKVNEKVVLDGADKLRDGMKIRLVTPTANPVPNSTDKTVKPGSK